MVMESPCVTATPGASDRRDLVSSNELPTLCLGETAPDAVRLPNLQGVIETVIIHRADETDRFGSLLSTLPFVFAFRITRRKEQMRVVAAA